MSFLKSKIGVDTAKTKPSNILIMTSPVPTGIVQFVSCLRARRHFLVQAFGWKWKHSYVFFKTFYIDDFSFYLLWKKLCIRWRNIWEYPPVSLEALRVLWYRDGRRVEPWQSAAVKHFRWWRLTLASPLNWEDLVLSLRVDPAVRRMRVLPETIPNAVLAILWKQGVHSKATT